MLFSREWRYNISSVHFSGAEVADGGASTRSRWRDQRPDLGPVSGAAGTRGDRRRRLLRPARHLGRCRRLVGVSAGGLRPPVRPENAILAEIVAGSLEFPPAVCGHHRDQDSLTRSQDWCLTSYRHFTDLARRPETGVALRTATFYFQQPVADSPRHLGKMRDLRDKVCGFVHDPALIAANGVNPSLGLRDAYAP
jgi:hypothetical protein